MMNYTDEVLFDAFAYDFQISYAVGLRNIGERYFARRTFYEFRARLYQYTLDHPKEGDLIFQQFETHIQHFIKVAQLDTDEPVSYTHLRAHETRHDLVCRLLL